MQETVPASDHERRALGDQLRAAWEDELGRLGFTVVDAPVPGIAGAWHWQCRAFPQARLFAEHHSGAVLLHAAEERLWAATTRTGPRVAALRETVQRLALLTAVDWRIELDGWLRESSSDTRSVERDRARLWAPERSRGLPGRLIDDD